VNQQPEHDFPYYRSPGAIRGQLFSHRMRGLDEEEVREYLDLLADQVQSSERQRTDLIAENESLREETQRLREETQRLRNAQRESPPQDEISPQAVILFSQAQQVADQLVEEAVLHARDLMTSARHQQREILEQAHRAAEVAAHDAAQARGGSIVTSATAAATDYTTPVPEIEYVRTFARVAQVQLRSVLEALSEQVDRLGEVPRLDRDSRPSWSADNTGRALGQRSLPVDPLPRQPGAQDRDSE
jgi:cell division initiation protein